MYHVSRHWLSGALLLGLLTLTVGVDAQTPPPSKIVSLGADLTPPQRQGLLDRFGAKDGTDKIVTIDTGEMTQAMKDIIPVPAGYKSISSTSLACTAPGTGLHVTTEHITRVTAGMYAGALLTAGIGDAELVVAAPADAEAEGMTALAGMFKSLSGSVCGRGEIDTKRRDLAYRWLATTAKLGDTLGDQNAASKLILSAQQGLVTGGKNDPAAIEPAINNALKDTGTTLPAAQRGPVTDLLKQLADAKLDWGTYAAGWNVQQVNPNEVRLTATQIKPGVAAPVAAASKSGFICVAARQTSFGLT
ncbi:MAG: hypothetical protein NVS4B8_30880 [Herpetosiphon sp.]